MCLNAFYYCLSLTLWDIALWRQIPCLHSMDRWVVICRWLIMRHASGTGFPYRTVLRCHSERHHTSMMRNIVLSLNNHCHQCWRKLWRNVRFLVSTFLTDPWKSYLGVSAMHAIWFQLGFIICLHMMCIQKCFWLLVIISAFCFWSTLVVVLNNSVTGPVNMSAIIGTMG